MKELINRIFAKRTKAETVPEVEKVIEALTRLQSNDDFQLIRGLLQCYYSDCAKGITTCPGDAVDVLRGQMYAYDRIFTLTGESGIEQLKSEMEQQKEMAKVIEMGMNGESIY